MIGVQILEMHKTMVSHYAFALAEEGLDFQVHFNKDGTTAHFFVTDDDAVESRSLLVRKTRMELRMFKKLLSAGDITAEDYDSLKASRGQELLRHQGPALEAAYNSLRMKRSSSIIIQELRSQQLPLNRLHFKCFGYRFPTMSRLENLSYSASEEPREVYKEFEELFTVKTDARERLLGKLFHQPLVFEGQPKGVIAFLHDNFLGLPHIKEISLPIIFGSSDELVPATWIDDWRNCHYALRHNMIALEKINISIRNFFDPKVMQPAPWNEGPNAVLDALHVGCHIPSQGVEEFNNFFTCLLKYPPRVTVHFTLSASSAIEQLFQINFNNTFRKRQMEKAAWHPDSANANPVCRCKSGKVILAEDCCLLNGWWNKKPA